MFIPTGAALRGRRIVGACLALVSVPAAAQTVPQDLATNADAAASARGLGDIVVTAQRRPESAQQVSAALTVISGSELERRNINTVNDLENSVPSLEVDSQFGGG